MPVLVIFTAFFVMNICELIGFRVSQTDANGLPVLILYYGFAVLASFSMLALALDNTGLDRRLWAIPLVTTFIVVVVTLLSPGAAIVGIENIGFSATRVPGPYYFVVQLGLIVPLLSMIGILTFSATTAKNRTSSSLAKIYLIAFAPVAITGVFIVLLMSLGAKINASGFVSLVVCGTIWVLLYTSTKKNQYVFMSYIPNTKENRSVHSIAAHLACPENGLKQALANLEAQIIKETLAMTEGNITHASEILGIGRSTLSQKAAKLEVNDH